MKKHLLFDLDRTLWDFEANADITFHLMYEHYKLEQLLHTNFETFRTEYKAINTALWEAYRNGSITKEVLSVKRFALTLEHFNAPLELVGSLSSQMSTFYVTECPKQTTLMPGCKELLTYLSNKGIYQLSVITNGFREAQLPKLKNSNLEQYFSHIFLSEDIGANKPNKKFFTEVLHKLNASAEECIVIGDDFEVDIEGAHNLDIDQIYYNPLHHTKQTFTPTHEVQHLSQIQAIL